MTLAQYLRQRGVTASGIGRALGVSHSTVLRWAQDRVPDNRVAALAAATGLQPAELRPDLARMFGATAPGANHSSAISQPPARHDGATVAEHA